MQFSSYLTRDGVIQRQQSWVTKVDLPEGFSTYMVQKVVLDGVESFYFYGSVDSKPSVFIMDGVSEAPALSDYFNSWYEVNRKPIDVRYFSLFKSRLSNLGLGNPNLDVVTLVIDGKLANRGHNRKLSDILYLISNNILNIHGGELSEGNASKMISRKVSERPDMISYYFPDGWVLDMGIDDDGYSYIKSFIETP